jgi:hypothetical protein
VSEAYRPSPGAIRRLLPDIVIDRLLSANCVAWVRYLRYFIFCFNLRAGGAARRGDAGRSLPFYDPSAGLRYDTL